MYHLHLQTISRADGRSATAAAAYRAGEVIVCERYGVTHDYSKKSGVEYDHIIGGYGMSRSEIWNLAEATENRKNSVVAREINIALPSDMSLDQHKKIVDEFGLYLNGKYKVAVDVAIHAPTRKNDDRNWHAHIMFTTRTVEPDGTLGKKTRILDEQKTGSSETIAMRAKLTDILVSHGADPQIWDYRSYEDRGIDMEPTIHEGVAVRQMEAKGIKTRIRAENNEIRQRNKEHFDNSITVKKLDREIEIVKTCIENERRERRSRAIAEEIGRADAALDRERESHYNADQASYGADEVKFSTELSVEASHQTVAGAITQTSRVSNYLSVQHFQVQQVGERYEYSLGNIENIRAAIREIEIKHKINDNNERIRTLDQARALAASKALEDFIRRNAERRIKTGERIRTAERRLFESVIRQRRSFEKATELYRGNTASIGQDYGKMLDVTRVDQVSLLDSGSQSIQRTYNVENIHRQRSGSDIQGFWVSSTERGGHDQNRERTTESGERVKTQPRSPERTGKITETALPASDRPTTERETEGRNPQAAHDVTPLQTLPTNIQQKTDYQKQVEAKLHELKHATHTITNTDQQKTEAANLQAGLKKLQEIAAQPQQLKYSPIKLDLISTSEGFEKICCYAKDQNDKVHTCDLTEDFTQEQHLKIGDLIRAKLTSKFSGAMVNGKFRFTTLTLKDNPDLKLTIAEACKYSEELFHPKEPTLEEQKANLQNTLDRLQFEYSVLRKVKSSELEEHNRTKQQAEQDADRKWNTYYRIDRDKPKPEGLEDEDIEPPEQGILFDWMHKIQMKFHASEVEAIKSRNTKRYEGIKTQTDDWSKKAEEAIRIWHAAKNEAKKLERPPHTDTDVKIERITSQIRMCENGIAEIEEILNPKPKVDETPDIDDDTPRLGGMKI